jgi:site-specific DNA-methyltransferase (adenine-specific)
MRVAQIGSATLYLGDCIEAKEAGLLKRPVAVISDPPYGIGFKHSGKSSGVPGRKTQPKSRSNTIHGDDKDFDPSPWLIADHLLFFGADHFRKRLPDGGRMLGWDKTGGGKTPETSFSDMEFMWTTHGGPQNIFHYMWKGILQDGEKGEQRYHVSQKPIALMQWAIKQAKVPRGGAILDPYMGSGSTGVAAVRSGFPFIGVEIVESDFENACARIERAATQGVLLESPATIDPTQGVFL